MKHLLLMVCAMLFAPALAQTAKPDPNLAGIAHIALRVEHLDASIAFYKELGLVKAFDLSRGGKVYEAFMKVNDHQFLELYPVDEKNIQPGFLHICFEGGDLNALHDYYVAQGLQPRPVQTAGAGNLLFTMPGPATPQGPQNLEYTQYLPGSLHSKDFGQHLGAAPNAIKLSSVKISVVDPQAARSFYLNNLGFAETDARGANGTPLLLLPGSSGESIEVAKAEAEQYAAFTLSQDPPSNAIAKKPGVVVSAGFDFRKDPDGNSVFFRHYHVLQ